MPKFALTFLLLCLLNTAAMAQEFKTVGYLPSYRFQHINEFAFDQLTHLNIAFANPNDEGELIFNSSTLNDVITKAHQNQLEVYISLAGGGVDLPIWEHWIKPEQRSAFIQSIVEFTEQNQFQGVDVDLEWGAVNEDYSDFVLELKDSLAVHNLGITAALPGTYRYPDISDEALAAFDWVNLMVYDLTGPWNPNNPGQHSPYSFAQQSIAYWENQGLPRNKMVLGVPFYGFDFTNRQDVRSFKYRDMVAINRMYAYIDRVGEKYYNGLPTISNKTLLALQSNLAGVMIWEIGQDHFGEYSLLNRIHETIQLYQNPTTATGMVMIPPTPNPVREFTVIRLKQNVSFELYVYDIAGKTLHTQPYYNTSDVLVDMSQFSGGVYFITLRSDEFTQTFKVVKM